jgi:hypothetical protein
MDPGADGRPGGRVCWPLIFDPRPGRKAQARLAIQWGSMTSKQSAIFFGDARERLERFVVNPERRKVKAPSIESMPPRIRKLRPSRAAASPSQSNFQTFEYSNNEFSGGRDAHFLLCASALGIGNRFGALRRRASRMPLRGLAVRLLPQTKFDRNRKGHG